jgi:hypothetical protein
LEDVQAGLNVAIQVLCRLTVFAGVQWFWKSSALRIARGENFPVAQVLSINAPGEVWDAISLLRNRIFTHYSMLVQSLLVVVVGLAAIFTRPIARFNTHKGTASPVRLVGGLVASRTFFCGSDNTLGVQYIWESLDRAGFPQDRLLDWLPDLKVDWQFAENDWSAYTWSEDCNYTKNISIKLTGTGVYEGDEGYPMKFYELDGLWATLNDDFKQNEYIETLAGGDRHDTTWLNVIMWIFAVINDGDNMKMALVSAYLDQPPTSNDTDEHDFGIRPVPSAYYKKVNCLLHRKAHTEYQSIS